MALNDSYILAGNVNFQGRIQASMVSAAVAIANEGWTVAFHRERDNFACQVLSAPATWTPLFSNSVATDANVLSDATNAGGTALTTTNVSTAQTQITDAHINTAVSGQWNAFIRTPQS